MATQGKKILLRALPILLLNLSVSALAADDPWDEAFNEKDTCTTPPASSRSRAPRWWKAAWA